MTNGFTSAFFCTIVCGQLLAIFLELLKKSRKNPALLGRVQALACQYFAY